MHNLYAMRQNIKPLASLFAQLPSSQHHQHQEQQFDTVYENQIAKIKQSQKTTKNVHVTPFSVIIPEQSYPINSDVNYNEVGDKNDLYFLKTYNAKLKKCIA